MIGINLSLTRCLQRSLLIALYMQTSDLLHLCLVQIQRGKKGANGRGLLQTLVKLNQRPLIRIAQPTFTSIPTCKNGTVFQRLIIAMTSKLVPPKTWSVDNDWTGQGWNVFKYHLESNSIILQALADQFSRATI